MLRLALILLASLSIALSVFTFEEKPKQYHSHSILTEFKALQFKQVNHNHMLSIITPHVFETIEHAWHADQPRLNSENQQQSKWNILSKTAEFPQDLSVISLQGNVKATHTQEHESKVLTEKLIIDKKNNTYHALGATKVLSQGQLLTSKDLIFDNQNKHILLPKAGKLIYTKQHENVG